MEHLTFLLSGPGDYLAGWLIQPASLADDEAHAFIAVALGIAFWIVLYIVLRLMWAIGRHNSRASKLMRTCHQLESVDIQASQMMAAARATKEANR